MTTGARRAPLAFASKLALLSLAGACARTIVRGTDAGGAATGSTTSATSTSASTSTSSTGAPLEGRKLAHPCRLPGSIQFTSSGTTTVPGGDGSLVDLGFLRLPAGFCAHYFGTVGNARQIRFAPGGELFVASPTAPTTGGNTAQGEGAIVVLPDDNLDGVADAPVTFVSFPPAPTPLVMGPGATTQGILFTPGFFYYQDGTPPGTAILRVPYATGQRVISAAPEQVANIDVYLAPLHWPKTMDVADDGTIYVANGGNQGETCVPSHPFHGGILKIDPGPGGPNPNGVEVAKGLRNPIGVRCARGHNRCFALDLAQNYSHIGRGKMVPIRQGDDWGFPCCASANVPYEASPPGTDCSGVAQEENAFCTTDVPFGVDFEPGVWPAMWANRAYVVTHGAAGTWTGARVVSIPMDPVTGLPLPSTNIDCFTEVGMVDFATGWDDGTLEHGRPAAVAFSSDGRLFVANDNNGVILWIAPLDL
jgi:hypothetical protein